MHLIPSDSIGSVKLKQFKTKPTELRISTGSRSRAASSLGNFLVGDKDFLKPYGTEGSIALFNFEQPGTYQITWQFYTAETDGSDLFLLWDGEELTEWATSAIATTQQSATRWRTDWIETNIEVNSSTLSLIALDTGDKVRSSEWRIREIDKIPEQWSPIILVALAAVAFCRQLVKP